MTLRWLTAGESHGPSLVAILEGLPAHVSVTSDDIRDSLAGRMVPQIARHQYSFQAAYSPADLFDLTVQGRGSSRQFDDDQNLFSLGSYFTMDLRVSRRIRKGFEVFAAFENIFNSRYEVGRTPIVTVGSPATARAGVRLKFGRN